MRNRNNGFTQVKNSFAAGTAVLLLFFSIGVHAGETISDAEILLFETNHLRKITKPEKLHYVFIKTGSLEKNFRDNVDVSIERIMPDGGKNVSTEFLSGPNKINFPAMEDAKGNPILLYFLERDIREMQRLTGGRSPYFRHRIRIALANHAEVHPVKIVYRGKEMNGKEIKITPYVNDELKERFGKHVGKYYVFTLSEAVPGEVYQLRSVDPDNGPDPSGKGLPLIEETLTFSSDENGAGR